MTKVVCISDSHTQLRKAKIPSGDILLHAGDITDVGDIQDIEQFTWNLKKYQSVFSAIVVCGGNHDFCFSADKNKRPTEAEDILKRAGIIYLQDSFTIQKGLKIYGSPWQPEFCDWNFNLPRGKALADKWAMIPDDTDILLTHSPPYGILDYVNFSHQGCQDLAYRVKQVKPKLHCYGHLHMNYGIQKEADTIFVNASLCNDENYLVNQPIEVEL